MLSHKRPFSIDKVEGENLAKLVELIACKFKRGTGTESDPFRTIYQLWTKDGELVAENDSGRNAAIAGPAFSYLE
jgi:hypothetical protein